jgi:hypothetical protein
MASIGLAPKYSFNPALHAKMMDKIDMTKPYVASVSSPGNAIALNSETVVLIINGGPILDEAKQQNKNIILFINGMPLKNIKSITDAVDEKQIELRFFIDRSDETIASWNQLTISRESIGIFTRKVSVSVGIEDQNPIPTVVTGAKSYTLVLAREKWFYLSIFIILALVALFIVLAVKTNILRDVGPIPPDGKKPYSLALMQMATWFFVIMSSWLLLYVVKHTFSTITESLAILMGISAGTGLGGATIDSNRKTTSTIRYSKGFIKDILSDSNGICFHRFQVFAWTVVMVAVFIRQVTSYFVMPEFNPALLTLMGISSGTYLGFKVSEKPGNVDASDAQENK